MLILNVDVKLEGSGKDIQKESLNFRGSELDKISQVS